MPLYEIIHRCTLTLSQRDALAKAITEIHSSHFTVPQLFVNVWFRHWHDEVTGGDGGRYVGGERECNNCIRATIRGGPARKREQFVSLVERLREVWYRIVPLTPDNGTFLHVINVMDSIAAGMEFDFWTPAAGEDVTWLRENWVALNEKAKTLPQVRRLVQDANDRGLMSKL